jgi:hypothetical protein
MQASMTARILSMTASSPDESVASNLQFETVLESSDSAVSIDGDLGEMIPAMKKACREERAAEVMSPVDSGERIMAKKGARMIVSGSVLRSKGNEHSAFQTLAVRTYL